MNSSSSRRCRLSIRRIAVAVTLLMTYTGGAHAGVPEAPLMDNITGAALFDPISSWVDRTVAPSPPWDGEMFYHTFSVDREVFVTSVEAAVALDVPIAEADYYLQGVLVHLDGPDAGSVRTGWGSLAAEGEPIANLTEGGVAPGIHLYRRNFGFPLDLDPGAYAIAVYAMKTNANPFSPDPWTFRVMQSSIGDETGFVAPPDVNFPPGEIDFTPWMNQGLNAAIRVNVYNVPAPGVLGVLAAGGLVAGRRRR